VKLRLALVAAVVTVAAVAAPSGAGAAALTTDRQCYFAVEKTKRIDTSDTIRITGTGFTPNGVVSLGSLGVMANPVGAFSVALKSEAIPGREKSFPVLAVDTTNTAIRASTVARVTKLRLMLSPSRFSKTRRLRIRARGFFAGKNLYAHVRRGRRYRKNIKIGKARKPCGIVNTKHRLFNSKARLGRYRVQFDNKRRYSKKTQPAAVFRVRVVRRVRSSAAAKAADPVELLSMRALRAPRGATPGLTSAGN
jgi:hypothetical protein